MKNVASWNNLALIDLDEFLESKMEPIKSLGVAMFFLSLGLQLNMDQETLAAVPIGLSLAFFNLLLTLPLFMILGWTARLKSHDIFMLGLLMNQIFLRCLIKWHKSFG